ncbi:hypothetical protein BpHYR1_023359 [Brachionus plicatilis]|uniref:Uncharacterized protein n=1 Tax=Brachionus plicatilis TaxID=10195 RepID=A0A3M7P9D9_BRAPC|nr:hypothetical protein BpHYR1_023359 [Brachionus plicatilis]
MFTIDRLIKKLYFSFKLENPFYCKQCGKKYSLICNNHQRYLFQLKIWGMLLNGTLKDDDGADSFMDYFHKQWVDNLPRWYEGHHSIRDQELAYGRKMKAWYS